jgi:hypothetical protein
MDMNPETNPTACSEALNEAELWLNVQRHGDRRARIAYARDARHAVFLRDAAGSNQVWMVDDEFAELVQLDDAVSLACFGRSETMQPHHLAFIAYKLSVDPHRREVLADADEVRLTLRKALDLFGSSQPWRLMKQAILMRGHEGPAGVWAEYVRSAVREGLLNETNTGPFETSRTIGRTVH